MNEIVFLISFFDCSLKCRNKSILIFYHVTSPNSLVSSRWYSWFFSHDFLGFSIYRISLSDNTVLFLPFWYGCMDKVDILCSWRLKSLYLLCYTDLYLIFGLLFAFLDQCHSLKQLWCWLFQLFATKFTIPCNNIHGHRTFPWSLKSGKSFLALAARLLVLLATTLQTLGLMREPHVNMQ